MLLHIDCIGLTCRILLLKWIISLMCIQVGDARVSASSSVSGDGRYYSVVGFDSITCVGIAQLTEIWIWESSFHSP